jgi:hypothetical protein
MPHKALSSAPLISAAQATPGNKDIHPKKHRVMRREFWFMRFLPEEKID